jgi:hypothetical protein
MSVSSQLKSDPSSRRWAKQTGRANARPLACPPSAYENERRPRALIPPPRGEGGWPKFIWASRVGVSHNGSRARSTPTPTSGDPPHEGEGSHSATAHIANAARSTLNFVICDRPAARGERSESARETRELRVRGRSRKQRGIYDSGHQRPFYHWLGSRGGAPSPGSPVAIRPLPASGAR